MQVDFNKNFEDLINKDLLFILFNRKIDSSLDEIIRSEILEKKEGFYIKLSLPSDEEVATFYPDKTGNEVVNNRILINDYFTEDYKEIEILRNGVTLSAILFEKLSLIVNHKFCIILKYDIIDRYTFITFHEIRVNEYWLDKDLNKYSEEAILKITD